MHACKVNEYSKVSRVERAKRRSALSEALAEANAARREVELLRAEVARLQAERLRQLAFTTMIEGDLSCAHAELARLVDAAECPSCHTACHKCTIPVVWRDSSDEELA